MTHKQITLLERNHLFVKNNEGKSQYGSFKQMQSLEKRNWELYSSFAFTIYTFDHRKVKKKSQSLSGESKILKNSDPHMSDFVVKKKKQRTQFLKDDEEKF